MPKSKQDKSITLSDGRTLAYTEHGDLYGPAIFFFHGNPGSRWMRHPDDSIVETLAVRIITPDRPGYGLSDFQKKRTLLDYPDDLKQLADALNLDQFGVFGVSAGGPYVAATAYALPERVKSAAIVSGPAPFDRDNPYEGVNDTYQRAYKLAKWPAWILRPLLNWQTKAALKDPEAAMKVTYTYISQADRELLDQPQFREQVKGYRAEAARQGINGLVREAQILVSPWGFDLHMIKPTIHLWYWADDTLVPPQMGRYLEAHMPHTISHFLPDGGHFSIFTHWRTILEALLQDRQT